MGDFYHIFRERALGLAVSFPARFLAARRLAGFLAAPSRTIAPFSTRAPDPFRVSFLPLTVRFVLVPVFVSVVVIESRELG